MCAIVQESRRNALLLGLDVLLIAAASFPIAAARAEVPPLRNTQQAGQHPPTPEESLKTLRVPDGFQVHLAAAEPDVRQPIAITFDDRGRLWVAESTSYDGSDFTDTQRDRILIFEDVDGDGVFDSHKVFHDSLNRLTGLVLGFGGVWITAPPNVAFIPDRDRDDRPDGAPVVHLDGWSLKAEHNSVNGLTWGPDGWLYGRHGIKKPSLVGRPGTTVQDRIELSCSIWRYHPTRSTFEVVADGTINPWGLDFDEHGQGFVSTSVVEHLWHLTPGARFSRWKDRGAHPDPYAYEMMDSTSDHLHWGGGSWSKGGRMAAGNENLGGGHSHSEAMIYLGDRWPEEYRGTIFMSNIHGRRINRDHLVRDASGRYVAGHGHDFLTAGDPWFRAVSMEYGPDGDAYVTDWSDLGECHDRDGVHRTSGRIYKVTWGAPRKVSVNLTNESNAELVERQLHRNEWFVRHARRLLQERAAAGEPMQHVHQSLRTMFETQRDTTHQLRALWALHVTGGTDATWLLRQLDSPDEHLRAWAVRLLVDDGAVRDDVVTRLARLAQRESSWLVCMELASALRRLPNDKGWPIAGSPAVQRAAIASPNLARMIWYGIEPAVALDPQRALALANTDVAPRIRRFIARRLGDEIERSPRVGPSLVETMRHAKTAEHLVDLLEGLNLSLVRRRPKTVPEGTNEALRAWIRHEHSGVRRAAVKTAAMLGDDALLDRLGNLLHDDRVDEATRAAALQGIIARRPQRLANDLHRLIEADQFVESAVRGVATIDDPALIDLLLARYARFDNSAKSSSVDVLIARASSALRLLDEVDAKRIPARDVSAAQARQMLALKNKSVATRLKNVWGSLNSTPQEKKTRIAELKASLTPATLLDANLSRGRELFNKQCSACHRLFGEGQTIAPELTGSGRRDLDYLLGNVVDPNAAVPADFRLSVVALESGRVISGSIVSQTKQQLTLQTRTEQVFVNRDEIEELKTLSTSLMPEGLLKDLTPAEIRDLLAYLMSDGPTTASRDSK